MNRTKNILTIGKNVTVKRNASTPAEVSNTSVIMKQPCSPDDEVYLKSVRLGCPYCKRTKVHRSLFRLNYHISTVHKFDTTDQNGLITQLEFLISRGVILS